MTTREVASGIEIVYAYHILLYPQSIQLIGKILNVVSTGFPSESAPEEESPFEHETFPLFKWSKEPMGSSSGASNVAIIGRCDHRPLPPA